MTMGFREQFVREKLDEFTSVQLNLCCVQYFE
jgi:hypothetical protein